MITLPLILAMLILASGLESIVPALPFLRMRSRAMSRRVAAAPGAGKTRTVARLMIIFDILSKLPIIAIDPNGALSNDVLDAIDRMPGWLRKKIEPRIIYINMAGERIGNKTYVFGFPFLYTSESGKESVYAKAYRFLDVLGKTDPAQASAPVMGKSAIEAIGENVLMALSGLNWQVTEAPLLLENPKRYTRQLLKAKAHEPEAAPAIDYLLGEYAALTPRERDMKTGQFLRKISPFRLDPALRAIYGAASPSLTPQEIVKKRLCVLLDFHDVPKSQRKLAIVWSYKYFDEYFRERGHNKNHIPIAYYIDELSFIIPSGEKRHDLIADDFQELLSITARNNQILVTVIHQDLQQFDKRTNELLSRIGTQILGASSDTEGSEKIAKRFYRYNKTKAKYYRPVYATVGNMIQKIDDDPVFETPQEQVIENSYKLLDMQAFHFLVGVSEREGSLPTSLTEINLEEFDKGNYVRPERVALIKKLLMKQHGTDARQILQEIVSRTEDHECDDASLDTGKSQREFVSPGFKRRQRVE